MYLSFQEREEDSVLKCDNKLPTDQMSYNVTYSWLISKVQEMDCNKIRAKFIDKICVQTKQNMKLN